MSGPAGVIVPVATPLDASGGLNEPVLRDLVDTLAAQADGVFVLGSSGELSWLDDAVAARVRAVARQETEGRVPLYVGVGDTSLPRTLRRLAALDPDSCDYAVVATPFYYPVEQGRLVDYYVALADASAVPLVLYNIPQNTGVSLGFAALAELARHDTIAGVKDSSGDMFGFIRMATLVGPDFAVLQGREQLLVASIQAGATGVVSALGNLAPRLLRATIGAANATDRETAQAWQGRVTALAELFDHGYWLAALKTALDVCGFAVGPPTAPMAPGTEAQRERIAQILASADPAWLVRPVQGAGR